MNVINEINRLGNVIDRAEALAGATDGPVPATHRLLSEQDLEDSLRLIYALYKDNALGQVLDAAHIAEIVGFRTESYPEENVDSGWYWYHTGENIFGL